MSTNSATSLSLAGLGYGGYKAYSVDATGNLSAVASSTGTISGLSQLIATGSYSLGAGKGYLINPFSYNGTTWATWSSGNDATQDTISHDQLVSMFGFGDASSGADTPDTVILNGVTIHLLSDGTGQGYNRSSGEMADLQYALDIYDGSLNNVVSTTTQALGWATSIYWSSQAYNSSSHMALRFTDNSIDNYQYLDSSSHYAVFQIL